MGPATCSGTWRIVVPLLLAGIHLFPAAQAGQQAERAIAQVKDLISRGEIKPGTVLRLRVKQGNMPSFLGRNSEIQKDWERQTGILLDADVMPQLDSLEFVRRAGDVDLTIARNHEYPDLFEGNLIEELGPLLQRYGFNLADDAQEGFILPRLQSYYGQRVVAIPADGDIAFLFLRQDLLDDPAHQARFKEKHKRDLRAPNTWREYQDLVEFFHRPADGFYGALEPREKLTGWFYWLPRYASQSAPNQYLFDERMHPLVDSPAGVAATESYIATVAFSPPEILGEGRDYSYTIPYFLKGDGFATIVTLAGAKIANRQAAPVRGKVIAVPMPGQQIGDRLIRRTPYIYGNNLVIPRKAPNKALALLFAMWFTDPDISLRSVSVASGLIDPYRHGHLRDPRIRDLYTPQAIEILRQEIPNVILSGTGLPGDAEYLKALNENLWLAARKEIGAKEAMVRTAREWEAITNRLGRDKQIARWQAAKKLYPIAK